jgi:metal-responsive CopG/Arc/MetJ family transcriptional regulator
MITFMRTIIDVPNEVIESLDRVRATEKRSRAAVIREAIDAYLEKKTAPEAEAAFGLWSQTANR